MNFYQAVDILDGAIKFEAGRHRGKPLSPEGVKRAQARGEQVEWVRRKSDGQQIAYRKAGATGGGQKKEKEGNKDPQNAVSSLTAEKSKQLFAKMGHLVESKLAAVKETLKKYKKPPRELVKMACDAIGKKYNALRQELGGSHKAAIAAIVGALVPFAVPFVGTPLTVAYFKGLLAIVKKVREKRGAALDQNDLNAAAAGAAA
jgi:hypothetical protein